MSDPAAPLSAEDSLDRVLAEYLRACERGTPPDRAEFLRAHPRHRQELMEFIANHGRVDALARSWQAATRSAGPGLLGKLPTTGRVGDYELQDVLAQGGMGVVYRARQRSLDRIVALKMICCELQDPQRFRAEAEAAAALEHPHIVAIYEIGSAEGVMYYSMPLIAGADLRRRLQAGPLPPRTAAAIAAKLAGAVEFAHQRGVLHRDLKPGNVMFDAHDEPIITDFGLAKSLHDDADRTQSGAVLGTPSYMAPEQASGEAKLATTAIDVYGLGAVLYAMLTGHAPFEGSNSLQVMRKVEREEPRPPRELRPGLPRDIEMICLKCLQKRAADRYASARDLQLDLQRFLANEPVAARPITPLERGVRWYRRNWLLGNLALCSAVLLAVAAFGGSALAWREYRARKFAEQAGIRERQAKQLAFARLVDLHTSNGRQAQMGNRQAEAMVWYATAAQLAAGTEALSDALVRVSRRQRFVPQPVRAALVGDGPLADIQFHPSGRYLLLRDGQQQVWSWDLQTEHSPQPMPLLRKTTVAAWSPDGNWLAAANEAGQLCLQDLRPAARRHLREFPTAVTALAFHPQGNWLAVAFGTDIVFFSLSGAEPLAASLATLEVPAAPAVAQLSVSPQGSFLLVAQSEGGAWLVRCQEPLATSSVRELQPNSRADRASAADVAAIGPRFVSDAVVALLAGSTWLQFSTATGAQLDQTELGEVAALAVDPQGQTLLVGDARTSRLVNLPQDSNSRRTAHRELVSAVDFHPSGDYFLTGCWDGRVQIWDRRDGRAIGDLQHQNRVRIARFSPDGRLVCTAQHDGLVRVWRWQPDTTTRQREPNPTAETWAKFNAARDGWFLAGTTQPGPELSTIRLQRFADPAASGATLNLAGALCDADFADNDQVLVAAVQIADAAGERCELHCCQWPSGTPLQAPLVLPAPALSVDCQEGGPLVAVLCANRQLRLVDRQTGALIKHIDLPASGADAESRSAAGDNQADRAPTPGMLPAPPRLAPHVRVEFSGDGEWLMCCGPATPLSLFHRRDHWSPVRGPQATRECRFAEFSPDSSHIVAVLDGGQVVVWDLQTESAACAPLRHNEEVYRAHFSPDGELLATACADNFARIFRWQREELVCQPVTHRADVYDALFSPDGRWLLTVGPAPLMGIWSTRDGGFVDQIPMGATSAAEEGNEYSGRLLIAANGRDMVLSGRRPAIEMIGIGELRAPEVADLADLQASCELAASARIEHGGARPLLRHEWLEMWQAHVRRHAAALDLDFPAAPHWDW